METREKICQLLLCDFEYDEELILEQIYNNTHLSLKSKQLVVEYFQYPVISVHWRTTNRLCPVLFKKFLIRIWMAICKDSEKIEAFDTLVQEIEPNGIYEKMIQLSNII